MSARNPNAPGHRLGPLTGLPSVSFVPQGLRPRVLHRAAPTLESVRSKSEQQEALRVHLVDEYRNHFQITVSIFKGITLSAAAYAFLAIVAAGGTLDARVQFTALAFWFASFLVMIVTYNAVMLHSLITIAATNVIDVIIPFLFGISEFLLFPILAPVVISGTPSGSSAAALAHLAWWPLGMTFLALVGSLFLLNSQTALTRTLEELPPHLGTVILRFKSLVRKNQIATAMAVVYNLTAFLVLRYGQPDVGILGWLPAAAVLRQWEGVVGVLVIVNAFFSIWSDEKTRRELAESLSGSTSEATYTDS